MIIKVLLVDDHHVVRSGIRAMLDGNENIEVVGEASHGREALKLAESLSPNVVIMDVNMPVMSGIEATRLLVEDNPRLKVIAFTVRSDLRSLTEMLKAGATGFITKEVDAQELAKAVTLVACGKEYLCQQVHEVAVDGLLEKRDKNQQLLDSLTSRECDVLKLLATGMTSKQVSVELGLAVNTIETHKQRLKSKLKIRSTAGLAKLALKIGLVDE